MPTQGPAAGYMTRVVSYSQVSCINRLVARLLSCSTTFLHIAFYFARVVTTEGNMSPVLANSGKCYSSRDSADGELNVEAL